MISKLTIRQLEILAYICETVIKDGRSPTRQAICDKFDFSATNAAGAHILALEKNKAVHRNHYRHRSIVVNWSHPDCHSIREQYFEREQLCPA